MPRVSKKRPATSVVAPVPSKLVRLTKGWTIPLTSEEFKHLGSGEKRRNYVNKMGHNPTVDEPWLPFENIVQDQRKRDVRAGVQEPEEDNMISLSPENVRIL